jgi:ABC-type Mn2+/Zn2+ transport system permease subunit
MEMDTGAGIGILFFLLIGLLGLATLALWIWSLIHCVQNRYLNDNNRLIGILLIIFLGLLGSLVYLFLPRETEPQR